MDYLGDATAIAAYFPGLTPPAGLGAIRESTALPPSTPGALPAVYVSLDDSELLTGNGVRAGGAKYLARFYLAESSDLARDQASLMAWASVLVDVLKTHVQLGGRVARAVVSGLDVALLTYSSRTWAGIELRIMVTTSESWLATA